MLNGLSIRVPPGVLAEELRRALDGQPGDDADKHRLAGEVMKLQINQCSFTIDELESALAEGDEA